jgi:hypothetical protein
MKVADQNSNKTPDPAPKQLAEVDPIDNAGHAVITVLNKAASISNEEYERAFRSCRRYREQTAHN